MSGRPSENRGHSHLNRTVSIDGARYINNAFDYPHETRITAKELRCILDVQTGCSSVRAGRMIAVQKEAIHLWLCNYESDRDQRATELYLALLDDQERAQQTRFRFERDRARFLVTRALLRTVLSRYLPVAPRDLVFSQNGYGRLEIANKENAIAGLDFNISHIHSLIVLAVSARRRLGVDVENVRACRAPIEIADRYFSRDEVDALLRAPDAGQQQELFFEYWTFKEAYIKARGMGVSIPLDKFAFDYPSQGKVRLSIDRELRDCEASWQFWQFKPSAEYLVAICAERVPSTEIVVRTVVALQNGEIIYPVFTRISTSLDP